MRKLLMVALGIAPACFLGAWYFGQWLLLAGILAAVAGILLWFLREKLGRFAPVGLLFLGFSVGCLWFLGFDGLYLSDARKLEGQTVYALVEATDYGYDTGYGTGADCRVSLNGKKFSLRVYLDESIEVGPGDRIEGYFRFKTTTGEGMSTYHRGNGTFLLAYQESDVTVHPGEGKEVSHLAARLRKSILSILDKTMPSDVRGFAKALLLGDRTELDYATDSDFQTSGISHVVAVSGMHVSILFAVVYLLMGKRRILTALVGIPAVILFAAVAGFTPSITRACVMQILMMLALVFDREYDPSTALSFSSLVMLLVNPMAITSISFQLSVGCMAGIFAIAGPIRSWLLDEKRLGFAKGNSLKGKVLGGFASSVAMTLGATVLTTPLTALYFGNVSLVGVLTNLLTLPVVTVVFYGLLLICLLGSFWTFAASALGWLFAWPIRYVLTMARILADFPLAAVYTVSDYITAWLIGCYVLGGLAVLFKRKRPLVLGCIMTLSLCAALLASWIIPLQNECRVTALNVGQGQCILLQADGKNYLVDCGGDDDEEAADLAAQTLLSQGISHLDGIIITHYDRDHCGGALCLLTRIPADMVFLPKFQTEEAMGADLQKAAGDALCLVSGDVAIEWEGGRLTIFGPENDNTDNETGLCVLFQTENCAILVTGDRDAAGEAKLVEHTDLPQVDLLILGHHGSRSSTSWKLMKAVQPKAAIISAGDGNRYGHPHEETLTMLQIWGCQIYRTDQDGTIIYRR